VYIVVDTMVSLWGEQRQLFNITILIVNNAQLILYKK